MSSRFLLLLLQLAMLYASPTPSPSPPFLQQLEGQERKRSLAASPGSSSSASSAYQSYTSWRTTRKMQILQRLLRHLSPREMSELANLHAARAQQHVESEHGPRHDDDKPTPRGHSKRSGRRQHVYRGIPVAKGEQEEEWNKVDGGGSSSGAESVPMPPDIECPAAEDGIKLFACPSPDEYGVYRCIDDHALCDHKPHCPNAEDEDPTVCMFHKMTMNYFKVLMDAVFGLSRSVV